MIPPADPEGLGAEEGGAVETGSAAPAPPGTGGAGMGGRPTGAEAAAGGFTKVLARPGIGGAPDTRGL